MMNWNGSGYDWSWIPMGAIMLLVLAALIVGGVLLIRRFPPTKRDDSATDALWLLRQRFVRGEIDQEEYTHKRDELLR